MITPPNISWLALLPLLLVTGTGLVAMVTDLWSEGPDREGVGWVGVIGLLVTAVAAVALWNTRISTLSDALVLDRYG